MRAVLRAALIAGLVLSPWAAPPPASAANLDTTADRVFGQPNFTSGSANNPSLSASSLSNPASVALDAQGNLYVADRVNNRVLEYDAPLTAGATADRVFGQPDFTSGTGNNGGISASSLNGPLGVALDSQGNLFVSDALNNRVLEYDAPLTTDTAADRVFGQPNFTSGTGNNGGLSATSLLFPSGVALDAQGNLYVADADNHRVLEYDAPLTANTTADRVFGQPDFTSGSANNPSLSASSLASPHGVAFDAAGNLFVADNNNNRVLEYDAPLSSSMAADRVFGQPNFTSNTFNNGGLDAGTLADPKSVALDAQGNLYVADHSNNRLLEYDAPLTNATADRVFGQPNFTSSTANNGGISANSLDDLTGVALDAQGNLYITDENNSRILEYDVPVPYGVPTLTSIGPTTVAGGSPSFALTVNGTGFVGASRVRWNGSDRLTTLVNSTRLIATLTAADVAGGGPFAVTVFTPAPGGGTSTLTNLPLYARAGHNTTADVVQGQPNFTTGTTDHPQLTQAQRLRNPIGVAVDPRTGRLFVADSNNHRVLSWPNAPAFANGQPADLVFGQPNLSTTTANAGGLSARSLSSPYSVAVDAAGNLYVADTGNHRVLEYDAPLTSGMAASRVFGQGGSFTTALVNNGGLSANSLFAPSGVALDAQGNLYVSDLGNNRVLEYNTPLASGTTADRVFGQPLFSTNTANNGGLSATSLNAPIGLALDRAGNLYVADSDNNRVLEYDTPASSDTAADRVFGQTLFSTNTANNGGLGADSLSHPSGPGVDGLGTLYVADYTNNRVLGYLAPLTTDRTADRVFGQPSFTVNSPNNGGRGAGTLYHPYAAALDARGNLYVTDWLNNRVLVYDGFLFNLELPLVVR